MSNKIAPLRGMKDLLPEEFRIHKHIEQIASNVSELYGYEGFATPILESANVFDRTLGDTSDVIMQQEQPAHPSPRRLSRCGHTVATNSGSQTRGRLASLRRPSAVRHGGNLWRRARHWPAAAAPRLPTHVCGSHVRTTTHTARVMSARTHMCVRASARTPAHARAHTHHRTQRDRES